MANSQISPEPYRSRSAPIDLLRIFAASAVVAFHYLYLFPNNGEVSGLNIPSFIQNTSSYGYLGVELFFMISGYVITVSAEKRTRSQFALARFVRLWPAFAICMFISLAALTIAGRAPSGMTIIANLTMIPHIFGFAYIDGAYWSLMFEIIFYTAIALFVISSNFLTRLQIFTFIWLVLALVGHYLLPSKLTTLLTLNYAPYFATGICVFLIRRSGGTAGQWLLGLFAICEAMLFIARQSDELGTTSNLPATLVTCSIILMSAAMVYAAPAIQFGPKLSKLSIALGGISYPLYLLHGTIGAVSARALVPGLGPMALGYIVVAIFALSYLVWRVEVPIRQNLLNRLKSSPAPFRSIL